MVPLAESPTRTEFLFLPEWHQTAFYILIAFATTVCVWQVCKYAFHWMSGKPISWKPDYLRGIIEFVLLQRKVRSSRPLSGAPMHLLIFYGFVALFLGTTLLAINKYSPWKFHHGSYYLVYEFVLDWMGLAFVLGVTWAAGRRAFSPPRGMKSDFSDWVTLSLLLLLGLTGFLVEGARMNLVPRDFDSSAPIGQWIGQALPQLTPATYVGLWWIHVVLVAAFIAWIPQMRLRHILFAVASAAGSDPSAKMGRLRPVTIEEVEATGKIGAESPSDFSRWHILSLDACMQCGRCTEVCPANAVGKSLDPQKVVQDIRSATRTGTTVVDAVSEDALWACTTCNACVEACPVLIRHVDLIVESRRSLVAEGRLSGTAATMLRQLQSTQSAWGTQPADREKWMEGEDVPLARDLAAQQKTFDTLLWIGCAGAVDPGAIRTSKAVVRLLKKAGVNFACLGKDELCTGDPARRTGDEFTYQQLADSNIQTFKRFGVTRIVTPCPHCFNTLRNEYGDFGGDFEVIHHTQLIADLIEDGRLDAPEFSKGEVTLHDPCYLGRVNGEADAPRLALGVPSNQNGLETPLGQWLNQAQEDGNALAEPRHFGRKTLCCGAGGGRMWMEEETDQRPSARRAQELLDTGASKIAVACPFCRIMLDTSVPKEGSQAIPIEDIAEIVAKANE